MPPNASSTPAINLPTNLPTAATSSAPIQMTRAQYQAQYGAPPPVPAAPIQMTAAQYQAQYGTPPPGAPATPTGPDPSQSPAATVFGNASGGNVLQNVFQSTLGSKGLGGLGGKPVVSAMTAGATSDVAQHSQQLAQVTNALINKINSLPQGDPRRDTLMEVVQENQKAMGISHDTLNSLAGVQETQGQNLGNAINSATVLAPFAAAPAAAADAAVQATKPLDLKIAQGAVTGAAYGGAQGAGNALQDPNATAGDVLTGTANGAGTGALLGTGTVAATEGIPKAISAGKEALTTTPPTIPEVVGKITQGKPEAIPAATRALTSIDKSGVNSFSDLSSKLDTQIKANTAQVDSKLGESTQTFKPGDVQTTHAVDGGAPVVSNPTKEALDQLQNYYEKTNNPTALANVKNLQSKFETTGLTAKEINGIARDHGSDLNAYNANGELASGLTKQAAENTRAGVKSTVDAVAPDAGRSTIDKNTSDLIKTKDMVDKMNTKVQLLQNKIQKLSPLQKVGQAAGKAVDLATGGLMKPFLKQVMGVGLEEGTKLDPIQLQENLSKNLQLLDKLNAMKPADAAAAIKAQLPKLPTR